jgi:hypothetical protein
MACCCTQLHCYIELQTGRQEFCYWPTAYYAPLLWVYHFFFGKGHNSAFRKQYLLTIQLGLPAWTKCKGVTSQRPYYNKAKFQRCHNEFIIQLTSRQQRILGLWFSAYDWQVFMINWSSSWYKKTSLIWFVFVTKFTLGRVRCVTTSSVSVIKLSVEIIQIVCKIFYRLVYLDKWKFTLILSNFKNLFRIYENLEVISLSEGGNIIFVSWLELVPFTKLAYSPWSLSLSL